MNFNSSHLYTEATIVLYVQYMKIVCCVSLFLFFEIDDWVDFISVLFPPSELN